MRLGVALRQMGGQRANYQLLLMGSPDMTGGKWSGVMIGGVRCVVIK